MKKLLINLLIGTFILLLFLSLIILTTLFLWENRKTVLSAFGVELEDNCRIHGLQLECDAVNFSTKEVHFQFKNLKAQLNIKTIFDKNLPIFYLSIQSGKGDIILSKEEKPPPDREKLFSILYYSISSVKLNIDKLNLFIAGADGKKIQIYDFSFITDYGSFKVKRPFQIYLDDIDIKIAQLSGSIFPDNLKIERLLTFLNNAPVEIRGKIDYRGDFDFSGRFSGRDFNYSGLFLRDFNFVFFIKKTGELFTGNANWKAVSIRYRNLKALKSRGKLHFTGSDTIKGGINTSSHILRIGNIVLDSPTLRAGFRYTPKKKKFISEGKINIPVISSGEIRLKNVISEFSFRGGDELSITGNVKAGKINTQYRLTTGMLKIKIDRFYVKDLLKEIGLYNKNGLS